MSKRQSATLTTERSLVEVQSVDYQPVEQVVKPNGNGTVDWYTPGLILLLGVIVLVSGFNLGTGTLQRPGPGLWPAINGGVLILTAPMMFLSRHRFDPPNKSGAARAAGVAAPLFLFVFLYDYAGLIGAGMVCLFIITKYVAGLSWPKAITTSIATPVAVYFMFAVLLGINFRPF